MKPPRDHTMSITEISADPIDPTCDRCRGAHAPQIFGREKEHSHPLIDCRALRSGKMEGALSSILVFS